MHSLKDDAQRFFEDLQKETCRTLEHLDGSGRFRAEPWAHASGGGGTSCVMENGTVFEKAGVNVSAVTTLLTKRIADRMGIEPQAAFATGISLVLHPVNPMVPAVHLNLRFFELATGDAWFGGGTDLTPSYLYTDDVRHFHLQLKTACDTYAAEAYERFKRWCDDYFTIRHRKETRGVGGIFFDYLRDDLRKSFAFVQAVGRAFPEAYYPIVERRRAEPWGEREKFWQTVRRGRYVEFNLVYDRGTLFGLETDGRPESILMSLPPLVRWPSEAVPAPGSREDELVQVLHHPRSWL